MKGNYMELDITKEEQQNLLQCIDVAVKSAQNSLQAASALLPLAAKISSLKFDEEPEVVKADDKATSRKK